MKGRLFALASVAVLIVVAAFSTAESQSRNSLRANQIRTRHIVDNTVTAGKLAFTAVAVNVATGTTGSSAAAPTLVGGTIIGVFPVGNQDAFIDNVVLNGDGSITITLGGAAGTANNFRVIVMRANGFGTT